MKSNYNYYYKNITKADSLYAIKDYRKAFNLFQKTFDIYTPLNTFRFREYNRYIISKHLIGKDISKKEFYPLIYKYGLTKWDIKKDSVLNLIYKRIKVDSLTYNFLQKKYVNSINMDLRNKIISQVDDDQYYRTYYDASDKESKIQKTDSISEKLLLNLFEKKIFPNKSIVGPLFYKGTIVNIEILLLHTSDSIRKNYFLPKIKKFVNEGKCNPYIYAMMIDQMEIYNDRKQIYGTYRGNALEKNKFAFYNSNRKKLDIGLPSIEFDFFWQNYLESLR
ncbi:hypothetical protein [Tenacibaculum ovolyticum]|uniref:hypothetical protein n=1 Tax=Tenacibaculum ovolyticum TaxID=104270 RepID=UPI0007ED214F|nr:hypothetical protein [Tenacibaculum ovolyticum]